MRMAADEVASLLCFDASEWRRVLGIRRWLYWIFAIAVIFVLAQFVQDAVAHLQLARQTGQWQDDFWSYSLHLTAEAVSCVIPLMLVVMFPAIHLTAQQFSDGVAALRAAVATRDARVVQPATRFVARLETEPVPQLPASFGSFRQPNDSLAEEEGLIGGFLLLMGLTLCVASVAVTLPLLDAPGAPIFLAVLFLLGLSISGWGAAGLRRWWLLRRPFVVHADELGLRWTTYVPRRREHVLPWSEIRSFVLMAYSPDTALGWPTSRVAFFAMGRDQALAWAAHRRMSEQILGVSDDLCRLILDRASTVLLDLTKSSQLLAPQRWGRRYAEAAAILRQPGPDGTVLWPDMPPPLTRGGFVRASALTVSPLLLLGAFYLLGHILQLLHR